MPLQEMSRVFIPGQSNKFSIHVFLFITTIIAFSRCGISITAPYAKY